MSKKCQKKSQDDSPPWSFWDYLHEREKIVFENEENSAQRSKSSFICNLWNWTCVHNVDRHSSLFI